ncbi:MAG: acyl-CoA thioesterase [Firmicutes bacterium]|nr:acyl-CoA thioesterase [Bacillota bacterium]
MWSFKRSVNYYETDRMGVVHHSNYLRYLEEARYIWMAEVGLPYPEFERQGVIIPCTMAEESFLGFLRYGDDFSVHMEMYKFTGLRMYFRYEVYNEMTGELCLKAETVHYTTTKENYKPTTIRRTHPELYEQICGLVSDTREK